MTGYLIFIVRPTKKGWIQHNGTKMLIMLHKHKVELITQQRPITNPNILYQNQIRRNIYQEIT